MPLGLPLVTKSYTVFLSSGDDAAVLRDRAEELLSIASQVLAQNDVSVRIDVDRWEHTPAHRVDSGSVNAEFVERAKKANLTLALILNEIRPGTLEELTAVLEQTDRDVALLWFREPGATAERSLTEFLERWKDRLIYAELGPPDDDTAWFGLIRVLIGLLVKTGKGDEWGSVAT